MEQTVRKVEFNALRPSGVKRVAAYARVSAAKDAAQHSLAAQVSYYSDLIRKHPGWLYCGVYADNGITGTKADREGFQRLMAACRSGEVDMVITKSISRLARNTVTLLETIRELKGLGVDVYFEEQNIHTQSGDGELMLTILASYAQEESRSASENQKWRVRENFRQGKPRAGSMLGYRLRDGKYEVIPEEAATVRRIFNDYLSGMGGLAICKALNEEGITTRDGGVWHLGPLMNVLGNYCYTGNLILQKTYRENHITKRKCVNRGELPMYHVEGFHEAIIPPETFRAVQEERARRAEKYSAQHSARQYPFTGKITCGCCGASYNRKTTLGKVTWVCRTFNTQGKSKCGGSKAIPEVTLMSAAAEVLGLDVFDPTAFEAAVSTITAAEGNRLIFHFRDGSTQTVIWSDRSRSESWTPEMRAEAGRKTKERWRKTHGERS